MPAVLAGIPGDAGVIRMVVAEMLLGGSQMPPPDPLLSLIAACAADTRPEKIDVGIGVYKDADGKTPVFQAVKTAERHLLDHQTSKSYLGGAGDVGFVDLLKPIIFGQDHAAIAGLTGVQTPGGTGALRLAAELIARGNSDAAVWLSEPTWPVHAPVFVAAGLRIAHYPYFDVAQQDISFGVLEAALKEAKPGDVVLLHGSCHNPTGADLSSAQWQTVIALCKTRELIPLIDLAYQGLGEGLDRDAAGTRAAATALPQFIVTYSCDKNFGLYRDRVGALFVGAPDRKSADIVRGNILSVSRPLWSMPPDHGAAVVRIILASDSLTVEWRAELDGMRQRILSLRTALAAQDGRLGAIGQQRGIFSTLSLGAEKVAALAKDHAIYMAPPGRINIAGLQAPQIARFARALMNYLD